MRARGLERGDPRPHPDERPLRVGEPDRRHVRPGRLRGVPPGVLAVRLERQVRYASAVHATTILWDLLCLFGPSGIVREAIAGQRAAGTLPFAWVAWPFTQYASSSNTNDAIQPALLVWGFYVATSQFGRGIFTALSSWTKFAPLLLLPLWAGYPEARRPGPRPYSARVPRRHGCAFLILLFEPSSAARGARVLRPHDQDPDRPPFAVLALGLGPVPREGLPDLRWAQRVLEVCLVLFALALGWWPRRRSPLQLAAFTAALLVGVRDRPHPLVVPLPAVVLPVRRLRAARLALSTPREREQPRSEWRARRRRIRRGRLRSARRRWRARAGPACR